MRAANLAGLYQDAGMTDVSVREAGRAVSDDYANYSAHLFLANSYERLRDPKQVNLRYETPAFAEYLIANLLAPVGAGTLSPAISQQEYSKLFARDGFGVSSTTEYQSGGNWFQEGAQYGTLGNSSYSIEGLYRSDHGQRPNNGLEQRQFSAQFKQQLTARDTVYFSATDYRAKGGDVGQRHDQSRFNPRLRTLETQEPVVLAGYHREWSPGHHTLLLGARLDDELSVQNPLATTVPIGRNAAGQVIGLAQRTGLNENYRSQLTIYSAELQQIMERPGHSTVVGGRYQGGEIETEVEQNRFVNPFFFSELQYSARQKVSSDFGRLSFYGYHTWSVVEELRLIGGLTYDRLEYPANFRSPPVQDGEETVSRLSPKAGLIWTPWRDGVARLGYAQGLGGASIDQSFQIEPSQVAGFNQSFRSIIPESVVGATAGARFESQAFSLEQRFPTDTYVALSGEWLRSQVHRDVGGVDYTVSADPILIGRPGQLRERLEYDERALTVTLNQLLGANWAFGARYRVSQAELDDEYPQLTPGLPISGSGLSARRHSEALLHHAGLQALYHHRSGFFSQAQALWFAQDNNGAIRGETGDDFWQFHVFAGWRFWQRRAEVTVGVLNLLDRDYELEPLNFYTEQPRERTFVARLKFKF